MTYYQKKSFGLPKLFMSIDFDQGILTTTPSKSNGHMEHHLIHKEPLSW
jgi:hypothetical protein